MSEDVNTTLEVEVIVRVPSQKNGELIDAIAASSKLTKADAGRAAGDKVEDTIYISISPGSEPNYSNPVISVNSASKLTKADAG